MFLTKLCHVPQEQRNGRGALHLAVDQQNLSLVKLLLRRGADPNLVSSGGHTPYHLTYGRHDDDIRKELYATTDPGLRELPDSESDDSEGEEDEGSDEEVCVRGENAVLLPPSGAGRV